MKIKVLILFIILTTALQASGGSLYSRYGIGDLRIANSARQLGLGGSGIALMRRDNLTTSNPASWGAIDLTRFTASLSFTGFNLSDKSTSAFYSETDFSGFLIGVPVSNDYGISLVGGLIPYSNVNYEVVSNESTNDLGNYTVDYSGSGGLSKAFIGVSYNLPFDLSLGATYEYYNGKTDYQTQIQFDQNADFNNSIYDLSLKSNGIGYTFGLISPDFAKFFMAEKISELRVGLTYQIISLLDVDSVLSSNNSVGYQELSNIGFERDIPSRLGVGLQFTWDQNYTFLFDYVNQNFSEYKAGGNFSPFLRDLNRFSLGFEYRHSSGRFGSTWEQTILRAGLSYEESPYYLNGNEINEIAAYAGLSFPMGTDNSIDFGLKYGIRGTTESNLVKENIFGAYVSINFGDLWFVRPDR